MPICQKCNSQFPNRLRIDGKIKNVHNRRYCLQCSPFGQHNTKQLVLKEKSDKKCICSVCNKGYIYSRKKGNSSIRCNTCYVNQFRANRKEKAVKLLGGQCCKCGYNKCIKALQFHHIDPKKKDFEISSNSSTVSWNKFEKEISKCILVCANCHTEIHAGVTEA